MTAATFDRRPAAERKDLDAKAARVSAIVENRRRLERVREAVARIEGELIHGVNEKRRVSIRSVEHCREAVLLKEIKSLRFDLDRLELH